MADKIPLIVLFVALGLVVGFVVYMVYKQRNDYFIELNNFINAYKSTVMYSKDTIIAIVNRYETSSKLLEKHLNEFVSCKSEKKPITFTRSYLSRAEIGFVKSLFELLGTSDAKSQMNSVDARMNELKKYSAQAEDKFKKNGNSSIKLGLLCGLLISILCI